MAYNVATKLMWILPPAVFLLSLLDWCLFFLYQKKFHFWVGIVEEDAADDELESDDEEVLRGKLLNHNCYYLYLQENGDEVVATQQLENDVAQDQEVSSEATGPQEGNVPQDEA